MLTSSPIIKWRNDVTRYFQYGHGERLPVMLLGLKRDLRKEGEGIIYPQEVDNHAEIRDVRGCLTQLIGLPNRSGTSM
jgi:hypothetical protein